MLDSALSLIERHLPVPVPDRQRPILEQIRRLAELHDGERDEIRERIGAALVELGRALDHCAVRLDEDGDPVPPDTGWEPWMDVEDWVLGKGKYTGSARRLAVLYLVRSLGLTLKRGDFAAGGLDAENQFRAQVLMNAPARPEGLPPRFWAVALMYGAVLADAFRTFDE
ncbi:hypothetical protein [Azospirillum soli]|uniref:hypothetical protein n=1 Tax=Azospirillum soli TaxID=1304799 RepID=UPI001AE0FD9A|nr:hypothetical protein [Azospirillum soli]MBP2314674.1 hypothetical protein [Azospirillum soli]